MRLMFFCGGTSVFGMEKVALTLMKGLQDRGHEVFCVASGWTDGDYPARLRRLGIPYEQVYIGKLTKSLNPRCLKLLLTTVVHWPSAYSRVRQLLADGSPDVILLYQTDALALVGRLLKGRRCLLHVHGLWRGSWPQRRLIRYMNSILTRYVAVSGFVEQGLVALGAPPAKTCIIYNGLEKPRRDLTVPRLSERQAVRIGIVGQVGAWKGHSDFVEALAFLAKKGLPFEGHVFGDGSPEFKAELRQKIGALGLEGRITWHGYVCDTDAIFQSLDVVTTPSVTEDPAPLAACEAGSRGLPVVATRRGGLPEIVEEGVTGFVVEAQRPDQLADRLERLIRDPALRQAMGERARVRISERFSKERMVNEFEALCQELAGHA